LLDLVDQQVDVGRAAEGHLDAHRQVLQARRVPDLGVDVAAWVQELVRLQVERFHRTELRQLQRLALHDVVGPQVDAAGARHPQADAAAHGQDVLARREPVAEFHELARRVLHALRARHAAAVVEDDRVGLQPHAAGPASHDLFVCPRRESLRSDFALAGLGDAGDQGDVDVDPALVAFALPQPLHMCVTVQFAKVVAAELVIQAGVGGPAVVVRRGGSRRGAGGRGRRLRHVRRDLGRCGLRRSGR
jgi:hypothetical protein